MLQINSKVSQRQIPKVKKYTASKMYYDQVYGYLQHKCIVDPKDKRKILTDEMVNFSIIGGYLGISRQTVSKKFKNLMDLGLLERIEGGYELVTLPSQEAFLISTPTLITLVNTLQVRTISVYVYLLNRYIANQEQPFNFTIVALKDFTGLSVKDRHNNYVIIDILDILQRLGLIEYKVQTTPTENGDIKTTYTLIKATNELPN